MLGRSSQMGAVKRACFTLSLVALTALGSNSAFAWDASQRLTVFEAAHQEALMCNREDLYQDLSSKIKPEFKASIDALYQQGRAKGLSEQDANYLVVKAAERIRQLVAKDYVPAMRKNKKSICDTIENRFKSHASAISKS
jgi:hypothetical protein